ncbi:MAG: alpha/beta fold hydrolase [Asticcacaulis sp.]
MSGLYPPIAPYDTGYVTVSDDPPHHLWYEQYGNPAGEPMLFVHGGPGAAAGADIARFFDPQRFRIINYHQRGAGKSKPFLSLEDNTTPHLVADIVKLRERLGVTGPMHVFGGSWGSFLSLIYALQHPDTVASLTLRGIFLGRGVDIDIAYQRDAQVPRGHYQGGGRLFPEAWEAFVGFIPPNERGDLFTAYYNRIHTTGPGQLEAARHWYGWEDNILRLRPPSAQQLAKALESTEDVMAQAILESHYFRHNCYLEAYGGDDYILKVAPVAHIPVTIVQGRYDQCTPRYMADELAEALNKARAKIGLGPIDYVLTVSGHLAFDEENPGALADAVRRLKPI